MTDTHDTNLPEKPVELEEEKKTAEVSEPATTETPAEEIVVKKAGRVSSEAHERGNTCQAQRGGCRRGERGKT